MISRAVTAHPTLAAPLRAFVWACALATVITLYYMAAWLMRNWPNWRPMMGDIALLWLGQLVMVWLSLSVIQAAAPRLPSAGVERIARVALLVTFCSVLAFASQAVMALMVHGDWQRNALRMLVWHASFCTLLVLAYLAFQEDQRATSLAHEDALKAADLNREMNAARLALLQAQVEPHFVFNALANARWLLRTDVAAARALLDDLLRYFEEALPALRGRTTTLARELDLARAYLAIHQVRMGSRLKFDVHCDPVLADCKLPPMLLLTLVENALRHGLQPLVEGGQVTIDAVPAGTDSLAIRVADTGRGMGDGSGHGTGLANIRGRLKAVYSDRATLTLAVNEPRGVVAILTLPRSMP